MSNKEFIIAFTRKENHKYVGILEVNSIPLERNREKYTKMIQKKKKYIRTKIQMEFFKGIISWIV